MRFFRMMVGCWFFGAVVIIAAFSPPTVHHHQQGQRQDATRSGASWQQHYNPITEMATVILPVTSTHKDLGIRDAAVISRRTAWLMAAATVSPLLLLPEILVLPAVAAPSPVIVTRVVAAALVVAPVCARRCRPPSRTSFIRTFCGASGSASAWWCPSKATPSKPPECGKLWGSSRDDDDDQFAAK